MEDFLEDGPWTRVAEVKSKEKGVKSVFVHVKGNGKKRTIRVSIPGRMYFDSTPSEAEALKNALEEADSMKL